MGTLLIVSSAVVVCASIWWVIKYRKYILCRRGTQAEPASPPLSSPPPSNSPQPSLQLPDSTSSPKTLSEEVPVHTSIGKGAFGEVFIGTMGTNKVAVKVFRLSSPVDADVSRASWLQETKILAMLSPNINILTYLRSGETTRFCKPELWIVTDLHLKGCLARHLKEKTLTKLDAMTYAISLADGLTFLHETPLPQARLGISHRDIKSENLLISEGNNLVIADFGLAITEEEISDPHHCRIVGTVLYRAPELLHDNGRAQNRNLAFWKRCDMYAAALVLWEILSRTAQESVKVKDFKLPYIEFDLDETVKPTPDDVWKIVKDKRPTVQESWRNDEMLGPILRSAENCWISNPELRLTPQAVRLALTENP